MKTIDRYFHRSILSLFFIVLLMGIVPLSTEEVSAKTEVGGRITSDTNWSASDSPIVTSSLVVEPGVNLTIESGATVEVEKGITINIQGTLIAEDVTFSLSSSAVPGQRWSGLKFEGTDNSNKPLKDIKVFKTEYGIIVEGSTITIEGGRIDEFTKTGIHLQDNGVLKITDTEIVTTEEAAEGILCKADIDASGLEVKAYNGINGSSGCNGRIANSVVTVSAGWGIGISLMDSSSLDIEGSLIRSIDPADSLGLLILEGADTSLRYNDIYGFATGIVLKSSKAAIDNINLRSIEDVGISSDLEITLDNIFWGVPDPYEWWGTYEPVAGRICIGNVLSTPIDIADIDQPPSAYVISPEEGTSVSDIVKITGKAYDPDGDKITMVEIAIQDWDDTVVDWTRCQGAETWSYDWDTNGLADDYHMIHLRVESNNVESVEVYSWDLVVDNGGIGGGEDFFAGLLAVCVGLIILIAVIGVIAFAYFFVIKPKKAEKKAQAQQKAHMAQRPSPQFAYQPVHIAAPQAEQKPQQEAYILEDVFLIFKDGRLIHHDTRRLKPEVDNEMLGGMFTAIQEFISQTFPTEDGTKGMIDEIKYGDAKIVLEHGKYVYLAAVVKDLKDTEKLHGRMSKLIKAIEAKTEDTLSAWDGQIEALSEAKNMTKLIFTDDPIE